MKNVIQNVSMSVALAVVWASLSGTECWEEFGPQPLACSVVGAPASPVAPKCAIEFYNDPVHNVLAVSQGFYIKNPAAYRCGYSEGKILPGVGCSNEGIYKYVGNDAPGHTALGAGCSSPD